MKKSIYIILVLIGILGMNSCSDDEYLAGNPNMEFIAGKVSALYGDSLPFTIKASDVEVPLSTLKAKLFYGEEQVSETVIRTKTSGSDYTGKVFIPYYPNIIDGRATLKFVLQNIHFTITEMEQEVVLSRPDFPYVTLVDEMGEEYLMKKKSLYNYGVTGKFPQDLKAYIKTPKVGENGNELTFGWDNDNLLSEGKNVNPITFSGTASEPYEVTFNALTYEVTPLVNVLFDGEKMTAQDANTYLIQKSFTQGQSIVVTGIDMNGWWINPDYFKKESNGTLTFLPVDGKYRVIANMKQKYFGITRMDGDKEAVLSDTGHGALWLMGWGIGSPSMDFQFGWDAGSNYCVPEISSKKYQFIGTTGPEHNSVFGHRFRYDYTSAKFFFQNGYGGEFSQLTLADDGTKSLIRLTDSKNIELLLDGNDKPIPLEEGATYALTVDLSAGNDKGVVSFKKISDGEVKPEPTVVQTLYFDFGSSSATSPGKGDPTVNPDDNGNYWNNITNNNGNYANAGTVYGSLFNSENTPTAYALTLNSRFTINGASGGGGLLQPDKDLLDDLAVATATGDYFFMEKSEDNSSFTFSNLDKNKGYKFYAFGSRLATQVRTAIYIISGENTDQGELQAAGTNCGGTGINQNIQYVYATEVIFPEENGEIKFTASRKEGDYIPLNVLKIEEYTNVEE